MGTGTLLIDACDTGASNANWSGGRSDSSSPLLLLPAPLLLVSARVRGMERAPRLVLDQPPAIVAESKAGRESGPAAMATASRGVVTVCRGALWPAVK